MWSGGSRRVSAPRPPNSSSNINNNSSSPQMLAIAIISMRRSVLVSGLLQEPVRSLKFFTNSLQILKFAGQVLYFEPEVGECHLL